MVTGKWSVQECVRSRPCDINNIGWTQTLIRDLLRPIHDSLSKVIENTFLIRAQRRHHFRLTRSGPESRLSDSGVDDGELRYAIARLH